MQVNGKDTAQVEKRARVAELDADAVATLRVLRVLIRKRRTERTTWALFDLFEELLADIAREAAELEVAPGEQS